MMFFFFNDTATTEIYTLSLHDALPICVDLSGARGRGGGRSGLGSGGGHRAAVPADPALPRSASSQDQRSAAVIEPDRKSTRLNSSHANISYAVFCLKKKKYQP